MLGSRVYVGTWGKYNDGNLDGAWVELSDFDSYEDFLDYAAELHKDEYSPEFMYQDWESEPKGWVSEYGIAEQLFELIQESEDFSKEELEALFSYIDMESIKPDTYKAYELVEKFRDSYYGDFPDEKDFAYYWIEEFGYPENMEIYFDYDHFAHEMFLQDFVFYNGHVFNRY